MADSFIGRPLSRVDGPAKVTGAAKYAAEFSAEGLLYGVVVSSAVAKGRIRHIDASRALAVPGVVKVLSHENRPEPAWLNSKYSDDDAPAGDHFRPLYDDKVHFSGQPVALVLADTFEAARAASALVEIRYEVSEYTTNLRGNLEEAYHPKRTKSGYQKPPKPRGDSEKARKKAPHEVEFTHHDAAEHHNPMEPHASTVLFNDGHLTIYDKTQGTLNSQTYVCNVFGLKKDQVEVRAPFVGGAFGSGLRPQYQLFLAVAAALHTKRSVRVVLTRQQMFSFSHRPEALHELKGAADENGKLTAIEHRAYTETSRFENYTDIVVNWSGLLYHCANVTFDHKIVPLDVYTPCDMRAPGAATGVPPLETLIDELAFRAGVDPLEFRLRNYAEKDENQGKPFSSKELRACYAQGAEKFGWAGRPLQPRSMREGKKLVGWGMATGVWEAMEQKASASVRLGPDGKLLVKSAITDIGTGTYTMGVQVAAELMQLPESEVSFELGNSSFPTAPLQGGSWTAASVGSAIKIACEKLRDALLDLALDLPQFKRAKEKELILENGHVTWTKEPSHRLRYGEILGLTQTEFLEETGTNIPNLVKQQPYTRNTHSAIFVEVKVDEDFGMVEVSRVVSAVAAGKILNPKTARSQILGGVVWGISQALHEESMLDHKLGRFMNHNFAEYHVPVMKDIREIDVIFVQEEDPVVSNLGIKGLGEIGIVGVAGAISNAIFHATGVRVHEFPITLDKIVKESYAGSDRVLRAG